MMTVGRINFGDGGKIIYFPSRTLTNKIKKRKNMKAHFWISIVVVFLAAYFVGALYPAMALKAKSVIGA